MGNKNIDDMVIDELIDFCHAKLKEIERLDLEIGKNDQEGVKGDKNQIETLKGSVS